MKRTGAFNTDKQKKATWVERAALACDLLSAGVADGTIRNISDIGCGDRKLERLIRERGWAIHYQGFDLVPQSADVHLLDLNVATPAGASDAAVVLGVLEYVDDIGACLRRVAEHAPLLVVSHTLRDGDLIGVQEQQERGWKNHLYASEFAGLVAASHWRILDVRNTSNRRTRLWLAERSCR